MNKTSLFNTIMKKGVLVHSSHLSFKWVPTVTPQVTIVVSKKHIPSAVLRNRFKRRIRSIFLESKEPNLSGIFFAKKGVRKLSFSEIKKEVQFLIKTSNEAKKLNKPTK